MGKHRIAAGIRGLSPAYFGLPMSTGIIAVASHALGYTRIGQVLFGFNNVEVVVLSMLLLLRLLFFFPEFRKDLSSHQQGAGFLTVVAAACILGSEYAEFQGAFKVGIALWYFALVAWMLLTYSFFVLVTIKRRKPSLESGMNGSWLLFVVSVQALSILGCIVAPHLGISLHSSLFIMLFFHLLGWLFYLVVIGIIFYRTTFFPMRPDEFKPTYWIDMGAAAITTLAGITLIDTMAAHGMYTELIPTLKVFIVFAWIAGTWWIPVIFVLEIWRHWTLPWKYHAGYWSLVFPLGMHVVCTWQLALTFGLPFLKVLPEVFIWLAWGSWAVVFVGMCVKLVRTFVLNRVCLT
ncbi:MAG: tellurite resistance/C4-dicarboxylate transporter family protein [Flavobacteriales bacterium]